MPNRYQGENHVPLIVNGKIIRGEYAGPQTWILERAKLNIKPLNMVDLISAIHDCDYYLAQLANTKEEQRRKVSQADRDMVKRLNKVIVKGLDNPINAGLAKYAMNMKDDLLKDRDRVEQEFKQLVKKRKLSIISKIGRYIMTQKLDSFSGDLEDYTEEDIKIIREFRRKKVEEFNSKVGNMGGSGIMDILTKIMSKMFGSPSKKNEQDIPSTEQRLINSRTEKENNDCEFALRHMRYCDTEGSNSTSCKNSRRKAIDCYKVGNGMKGQGIFQDIFNFFTGKKATKEESSDEDYRETEKRERKEWEAMSKQCKQRGMQHMYGNMYGNVGNCYPYEGNGKRKKGNVKTHNGGKHRGSGYVLG